MTAILAFGDGLRMGQFNAKEIEAIALAVAQENGCDYCLAAHTAVGKMLGFSQQETIALRGGSIGDPKLRPLTRLAKDLTATKGHPSQQLIDDFFAAGYGKAALVELIGFVALHVFNNYLDHISGTPIDYPVAENVTEEMAA